jgi:hypothetical protein
MTMSENEKTPRTVKRVVIMRNLTPDSTPGSTGYKLFGDTPLNVEIADDGVWMKEKGKRGDQWMFLSWDNGYISAVPRIKTKTKK